MMVLPASPVLAASSISLNPEEGKIGDDITVSGADFPASGDDPHVDLYFSSDVASVGDYIGSDVIVYEKFVGFAAVDELGEFQDDFEVPEEMTVGDETVEVGETYYAYVTVYDSIYIRAKAEFTVVGGELTIDPDSGPVDTEVEITGIGFSTRENITIEYDGDEVDIESGDDETDSDGDFDSTILIPESTAGDHTIRVTVSSIEVDADFTVEPEIIMAPTSGTAGSSVAVSGTGFDRRSEVTVYFDNTGVASSLTNSDGSFTANFNVPDLEAGIYDIEAEDDDGNVDTAKFTITVPSTPPPTTPPPTTPAPTTPAPSPTSATISVTSGAVGASIVIGGAGFEADGTITIKYDGANIATAKADANGIFWAAFAVPAGKSGDHVVIATDGTSTEQFTFTVESTAPPAPEPLVPAMGVEVEPPVAFDWKNVTDESVPITYTLQIATSQGFSSSSIVVEKEGLQTSVYTVTETEQEKLAGQADPYYWRVRAVDAAANEGTWSGVGEFYVSPPFSLPGWAMYTLIGLGGLVLFAVGYWLGRRAAYYY
ncbi:IPT/TIG domain-containing protein [Chloroflexota bacterium]